MAVSYLYQNVRGVETGLSTIFKNPLVCEQAIISLRETWLNNAIFDAEILTEKHIIY